MSYTRNEKSKSGNKTLFYIAIIGVFLICYFILAPILFDDNVYFIINGEAELIVEDRIEDANSVPGKWVRGVGYIESHKDANTVFAGKIIGAGDFNVVARLTLSDLDNDKVYFHIPEVIWELNFNSKDNTHITAGSSVSNSLDSSPNNEGEINIVGRISGKKKVKLAKTKDLIKAGESFLFEMTRKSDTMYISIDGKELYKHKCHTVSFGLFGFQVLSGSVKIIDFWASGNLLDIPSSKGIEETVVFQCFDKKPDGSYVDGVYRFRIPALVVAPNNDLLAFAEARHEGAGDHGNIDLVLKRSNDGGRTWGKTQLIYEEGGYDSVTIGNPCIVVDEETDVIWMAFCRHNKDVLVTSSADNGSTWTTPVDITAYVQRDWKWYATGPGIGIQLKYSKYKGRLVIPINHKPSGIFYSDDHGKTWQLGGSAPLDSDESQVVELVDGRLMLNCRAGKTGRKVFISNDGGGSWEKYKTEKLILGGCQGSIIRYSTEADSGFTKQKNRLLFSNPNHPNFRVNLCVRISYDEGLTWPVSRVIDPGSAQYSCLVVLPDGDIGVLYEDALKSRLTYARFSLDWLTDGEDSLAGD